MDDMQRYLVEEFVEDYKEGRMPRRELMKRISLITGAAVSGSLLAQLGVPEQVAQAQAPASAGSAETVSPNDPEIAVQMVSFPGDGVTLMGYHAQPSAEGSHPGVVLVTDNRALSPHIMDVGRRAAKAGFSTLVVDLVSREGGTDKLNAEDPARVPGVLGSAPAERHVADLSAGLAYLQSQPNVRPGGIGVVGFCFGGGIAWLLALANPAVTALVPFYGPVPPTELIPNLAGPVLLFFGRTDGFVNPDIPRLVTALMEADKVWSMHVYAGAGHAFYNDTDARYRPEPAQDAWAKTVAFLGSTLPQA
jgi:carboxymethylenebutenolidase